MNGRCTPRGVAGERLSGLLGAGSFMVDSDDLRAVHGIVNEREVGGFVVSHQRGAGIRAVDCGRSLPRTLLRGVAVLIGVKRGIGARLTRFGCPGESAKCSGHGDQGLGREQAFFSAAAAEAAKLAEPLQQFGAAYRTEGV